MEAALKPVAVFVTQPPLRNATVGMSPEEHGYGKNIDGKDTPKASIKFNGNRYESYDEDEAEHLRKHIANTANGGDVFFEVPQGALRHGRAIETGDPASMPDEGLSDEDREFLVDLTSRSTKQIPPPSVPGLIKKMAWAVQRFHVINFDTPSPDRKIPIIKGRLLELLEILEGQGITVE